MWNETDSEIPFYQNYSLAGLRRIFYLVTPAETQFETLEEMPDYIQEALPWIIILGILEDVFHYARKDPARAHRMNDFFTSCGQMLMQILFCRVLIDIEVITYVWIYDRFHLFNLAWNSNLVWFAAILGVDLGYYLFHLASHRVAFLWTFHQAHHGSEDFSVTASLRQSIFHLYFSWPFYAPLAIIGIPPTVFAAHQVFQYLFMFWIHTEVVGKMGPFEWFLTTPSHHRVHHGRNPYCIDMNYGGCLIIWDFLFGTFTPEREGEDEVVYGLIENVNSFNPWYLQFHSLNELIKKAGRQTSWIDKIKCFIYPPDWLPGHSWSMRCHEHTWPEVEKPVVKYDPKIPAWHIVYTMTHFIVLQLLMAEHLLKFRHLVSTLTTIKFIGFSIFSLQCFGMLWDGMWYGPVAELSRCVMTLFVQTLVLGVREGSNVDMISATTFGVSCLIWACWMVWNYQLTVSTKGEKKKL